MILRGQFFSAMLEMETGISVLVPNRALTAESHKVVYLLHGLCGRNGDWLDYTMLPVFAEKYNVLFVMPEVARSFYTDMVFGQKYFSYVVDELPVICRNVFNFSSKREDTLILGASMGGYGALKCALSRPERYGSCGAFSSACLFLKEGLENQRKFGKTDEMERQYGKRLINDFEAIFGSDLEWQPENEILELAKNARARNALPELYLACGTGDFLYKENKRFETELRALDAAPSFREWSGIHDWKFFNEALEKALEYFLGN